MCSEIDPTTDDGLANLATGGLHGATKSGFNQAGKWVDDKLLGGDAEDAAIEAAAQAAAGQQSGLDYLMSKEEIPEAFRQAGLTQLGSLSGFSFDPETGQATFNGDMSAQQGMIDQAKLSPLYQSIMGTGAAGEEALARRASMGTGARGAGTVADITGFNQDLEQQALLESYNQQLGGLQGLAGIQSQAPQISQQFGQIGQTQAQGTIAGAQARQDAFGNVINAGTNIGAAYAGSPSISDVRLKTNIKYTGPTAHPEIHKYEWEWLEKSGKEGNEAGYLAQEVEKTYPDLVIDGEDGYKRILKDELESKLKELN